MTTRSRRARAAAVLVFVAAGAGLLAAQPARADRVDELKEKIEERNANIGKLEEEIREYERKIDSTQSEIVSLEGALEQIDATRNKLSAEISVTENRIDTTSYNIERLDIKIAEKREEIATSRQAIIRTLQELRAAENETLVEALFLHDTISDFWRDIGGFTALHRTLARRLDQLEERREALAAAHEEALVYKDDLVDLKKKKVDQKVASDIARREKDRLLSSTKNEQDEYERILAEKRRKRDLFQKELEQFETALKEAFDPGSLPAARPGVLSFPLRDFVITQYFGNTRFATQNPQVYSGSGHNGIDLAAPVGTLVYPARAGMVIAAGDTDTACKDASYGKWILVRHDNGLSTLYAHLSNISVGAGETVSTRSAIGHVGNTGYSTGPHLHFTVYASDAVRVTDGKTELKSRACPGAVYRIPLLKKSGGYLNPLSYLPSL